MKPYQAWWIVALAWAAGCNGPAVRSQSPEEVVDKSAGDDLVGDFAVPYQMNPLAVEAIGLVSGLAQTGSDPPPSPQRAHLVDEMRTRGVDSPNQLLATNNYSLVLVRGFLRPGIQKGDRFDIELRVPSQSESTSLRGGWLMETRLKQLAVLGQEIREGNLLALAEGPLLVDPPRGGEVDQIRECRARVLGGGVCLVARPVALVLKPDYQSASFSARVASAINLRFHTFSEGAKEGVAKAKDNQYIELTVHPRYKDNIERYVRILRSVPLKESATDRVKRLNLLERELLDPVTAQAAAMRLEAIGRDGIKALKKGILSADKEVRFYSAEALAYLDESAAAVPLADAIREEPAFRVFALAALSAMDDVAAYEQLCGLLNVASAETRYGAFRALWAMNPRDALIRGEPLSDQFGYHVLDVTGPPMIHATRSYRAEIVLFGKNERLKPPLTLDAGKIMVNAEANSNEVTLSKFTEGEPDQKRRVSTRVDDVIRAVVELGGTYPDIVQFLERAKQSGALGCRFEVDALPEAGRSYVRAGADEEQDTDDSVAADDSPASGASASGKADGSDSATPAVERESTVNGPTPDLFSRPKDQPDAAKGAAAEKPADPPKDASQGRPLRSFFAKMAGRN